MLVAMLDVNIIISSTLTDRGVIREVFNAWKDGAFGRTRSAACAT